jgi:hypothetical protein
VFIQDRSEKVRARATGGAELVPRQTESTDDAFTASLERSRKENRAIWDELARL